MIIIRWSGCSGIFHVPGFIEGLYEMYCYKDLIISNYYKILVIYTQGYTFFVYCQKMHINKD